MTEPENGQDLVNYPGGRGMTIGVIIGIVLVLGLLIGAFVHFGWAIKTQPQGTGWRGRVRRRRRPPPR